MTHGEAWYENKQALQELETLDAEEAINKIKLPKKMTNSEASRHYNIKLFHHWVYDYDYDKRVTLKQRKELISALMFGNRDKYKQYEELR
jgi:hypothetical protein